MSGAEKDEWVGGEEQMCGLLRLQAWDKGSHGTDFGWTGFWEAIVVAIASWAPPRLKGQVKFPC